MADRVSSQRYKENRTILRHVCVDHYILLLNYQSNHLHFITSGFKRFQTNSTDPRQRVPLTVDKLKFAVLGFFFAVRLP